MSRATITPSPKTTGAGVPNGCSIAGVADKIGGAAVLSVRRLTDAAVLSVRRLTDAAVLSVRRLTDAAVLSVRRLTDADKAADDAEALGVADERMLGDAGCLAEAVAGVDSPNVVFGSSHPNSSGHAQVDMIHAVRYALRGNLDGAMAMTMNVSTVGWKSEPTEYRYGWHELALYALGIGAQASELDYLYEGRGPKSYPTFAVVPAISHCFACLNHAQIPLESVVQGGQAIRKLGPIPAKGMLRTHGEILGFYDMKRFAEFAVRTRSVLPDGAPVVETEWTIIVRGAGGFGGSPPPKLVEGKAPRDRKPDFCIEQKTRPEQALLYRLSGDINPLHADPEVAAKAGFGDGPILHGLATFGFSARAVVAACCGGDADRLTYLHGKFRRPVWPGDTLTTEGWHVEDRIVFQTRVASRDDVVISNAWAKVTG